MSRYAFFPNSLTSEWTMAISHQITNAIRARLSRSSNGVDSRLAPKFLSAKNAPRARKMNTPVANPTVASGRHHSCLFVIGLDLIAVVAFAEELVNPAGAIAGFAVQVPAGAAGGCGMLCPHCGQNFQASPFPSCELRWEPHAGQYDAGVMILLSVVAKLAAIGEHAAFDGNSEIQAIDCGR